MVAELPGEHRRRLPEAVDRGRVGPDLEQLVDDEDAPAAGGAVEARLVRLCVAVVRVGTGLDQLDGAVLVLASCEEERAAAARIRTS
jgi:hypothetical protein